MRITYQVGADSRHDQGKGASRRLRRAGKVPAVIYGGQGGPRSITLDHQQLLTLIDKEKFYSSIISVNVDSQSQPAIIRDVQMHPARNAVVHVDLQRVVESEKLRIHLPIHFKGEAVAPGVKTQGGIVSHLMQDVEVSCLPADLPEFLELDLSAMNLNDTLSLETSTKAFQYCCTHSWSIGSVGPERNRRRRHSFSENTAMLALRTERRKNLGCRKQFLNVHDRVELVVVYAKLFMNRWSDFAVHIKAITDQGTRSGVAGLFEQSRYVEARIVCYLPQKTVS